MKYDYMKQTRKNTFNYLMENRQDLVGRIRDCKNKKELEEMTETVKAALYTLDCITGWLTGYYNVNDEKINTTDEEKIKGNEKLLGKALAWQVENIGLEMCVEELSECDTFGIADIWVRMYVFEMTECVNKVIRKISVMTDAEIKKYCE